MRVVATPTDGEEAGVTARETKLLGGVFGGVATLAAVNGLGYLIAGGSQGYNSAQGGANLVFLLSLLTLPVGVLAGGSLGGRLAGRPKPPADRGGPPS